MGRYCETYVYDEVGNILEMAHRISCAGAASWTRTYDYDEPSQTEPAKAGNRLTRTTIGANAEIYSALGDGYDAHGNMQRMPHLHFMQWDFMDRLRMTQRKAVNAGDEEGVEHEGERTWYVYDAGGQRIRKVTELSGGEIKDERLYLGGFEIYRRNGVNPLVRERLHIMDDAQRIALVETRTHGDEVNVPARLIRYQFGNHLGSASLELDAEAQIVSYEEYTPYGSTSYQAVRNATETPKRYRYTGMERDDESGLNYHGARYYASWLGRWVSADPIGIEDGVNVYWYAHDNPIKNVDVRGTDAGGSGANISPEERAAREKIIADHDARKSELQPMTSEWVVSTYKLPKSIADALVGRSRTTEAWRGGPFVPVVSPTDRYVFCVPGENMRCRNVDNAGQRKVFTPDEIRELARALSVELPPEYLSDAPSPATGASSGLSQVRLDFARTGIARVMYALKARAISAAATAEVVAGKATSTQAAATAVAARRALEAGTRDLIPETFAKMSASRNVKVYGDPLGPATLDQARVRPNGGPLKTDIEVIQGAGKTSPRFNAAGTAIGVLGIIGQITSALSMSRQSKRHGYVDIGPIRVVTDPTKLPEDTIFRDFVTGQPYRVTAGGGVVMEPWDL